MKVLSISKMLFVSALALGAVFPAAAEDKAGDLTPAAAEQIVLVSALARYGEARHDPILLIAAARLAKGVTADAPPAAAKLPTMEELLADATEFADGDEFVLGLVADVRATQSKGYCYGDHGTGWC